MQKRSTLAAVVGGLLAIGSVASATVINGYDWDNVYTGAQLPEATDSEWSVFMNDGASATHPGDGTLVLTSPAGDPTQSDGIYVTKVGDWAPSASATAYAEFKVKTSIHAGGYTSGTSLNVFTAGGGGVQVLLRADGLALLDNNGDPGTLAYAMDTSVFHVYRIAANSVTNTYSVDVDGVTVLTNKPLHEGLAVDVLRIGDPGSFIGGAATYEYVAFNNASAPIEVPEPAGLTLLAIAGLASLRRRA